PADSTPRANPLTTTTPRTAGSAASRSATANAYGDPAREPTIATAGRLSAAATPRIHNTGGGSTIRVSAGGYAASLHAMGVKPSADPRAIAAVARARIDARLSGSSDHRSTNSRSNTTSGDSPERSR